MAYNIVAFLEWKHRCSIKLKILLRQRFLLKSLEKQYALSSQEYLSIWIEKSSFLCFYFLFERINDEKFRVYYKFQFINDTINEIEIISKMFETFSNGKPKEAVCCNKGFFFFAKMISAISADKKL